MRVDDSAAVDLRAQPESVGQVGDAHRARDATLELGRRADERDATRGNEIGRIHVRAKRRANAILMSRLAGRIE